MRLDAVHLMLSNLAWLATLGAMLARQHPLLDPLLSAAGATNAWHLAILSCISDLRSKWVYNETYRHASLRSNMVMGRGIQCLMAKCHSLLWRKGPLGSARGKGVSHVERGGGS